MSADKRAEFAYQETTEAIEFLQHDSEQKDERKEYKSYCKKLPMMIKTNGLGATIAFIGGKANGKSKGKKAYRRIQSIFHKWLTVTQTGKLVFALDTDVTKFPGEIVKLEPEQYRAAAVEVLSLLQWMRRFAEGLIEGESEES